MTKRQRTTPITPTPPLTRMASLPGGLSQEQATYQLLNWFNQIPDPDETLQKLGFKRQDLRKLSTDDEVYQCIEKRAEALLAVPWRLEPGSGRAAGYIVEEITPHLTFLTLSAFMAVPYGYSVAEVMYAKRDNGRIGIDRIAEKPFEWFVPSPNGELRYHPEDGRGGAEGLLCDPRKFMLSRHNATYRNPFGEALFSRLYWPVFFRSNGWRFWAQFLERFGTPMLLGKTMGDANALATALSTAVQDAVIVAGNGDEISAVESGKDGQQFKLFEDAILSRIQKSILGQTLSSDAKATGMGSGVADLHKHVMEEKTRADMRLVMATVQRLIDALHSLNGFGGKPPQFVLEKQAAFDLGKAKIIIEANKAGMIRNTAEFFTDVWGISAEHFTIPDNAPVIDGQAQRLDESDPEGQSAAQTAARLIQFAKRKQQFTPQQQAIEDQADALLAQVPEPIDPSLILSAVKAATDPADLAVRLALLLDQRDPRFTELLARANFAAQTLGYVVAEVEAPQPKAAAPAPVMMAPPNITLNMTAPITMAAAEPSVTHITNQINPTPLEINVEAPNVNVTNEVQPAAVALAMPLRKTVTEIERDDNGEISKATQIETDA